MIRFHFVIIAALVLSGCKSEYQFRESLLEEDAPTVTDMDPPGPPAVQAAKQSLRLVPRQYVGTILKEAFGSASDGYVPKFVTNQVNDFGGPCDPYGRVAADYRLSFQTENCQSSQAPMVPNVDIGRISLTIRACDKITSINSAVTYAAGVARKTPGITVLPVPTDADIEAAYDLFFRGRPISPEVHADLKAVVEHTRTLGYAPIEGWRFLLLTLCKSPYWQIP